MGRPPGVKNGAGSNGGSKNVSNKPSASGKNVGKGSNATTTSSASGVTNEKDKTTQDRSQSNFPYDIRLNSYASLYNAVTKGTPRVKRVLTEECDYIMECRVCRNLFRSLPNFITHKLNYCKKAYDSTWCLGLSNLIPSGDPSTVAAPSYSVEYEVDPELVLVNTITGLSSSNQEDSHPMPNSSQTRSVADLYKELEERTKVRNEKLQSQSAAATSTNSTKENVIRLQLKPLKIQGESKGGQGGYSVVTGGGMNSVVVQQQIVSNDPSSCDNVCTKPLEVVRKDTAILGPDGKVLCTAPGQGIERVISRLTAQLKALEEKQAQKMAEMAKNEIICDICKTVYDSEKALRQHRRESLDCGKIWGFKSPNHDKSSPMKMSMTLDTSSTPSKPTEVPSSDGTDRECVGTKNTANSKVPSSETSSACKEDQNDETAQCVRLPRFLSPAKSRRSSHHHSVNGVSPSKAKRTMSPVKKIKMKYSKLDSSSSSSLLSSSRSLEFAKRQDPPGILQYSCSRCSSSFTSKSEMSLHLSLCSGVINYAYLRENEPPREKIRISLRNDFTMGYNATTTAVTVPQPTSSSHSTNSESHSDHQSSQQFSGANFSRGSTPTVEVNNNKQYKSYLQQTSTSSSSSEEEDSLEVAPTELEILTGKQTEEERDSDITSHDSGVSSGSSTRKKTKMSSSASVSTKKLKITSKTLVASSKSSTASSGSSGTSKIGGGSSSILSERPEEKKTDRKTLAAAINPAAKLSKPRYRSMVAFNLRKRIESRIRKSQRIQKSVPPPPNPQGQNKRRQSAAARVS